jgi:hypothetical protein
MQKILTHRAFCIISFAVSTTKKTEGESKSHLEKKTEKKA